MGDPGSCCRIRAAEPVTDDQGIIATLVLMLWRSRHHRDPGAGLGMAVAARGVVACPSEVQAWRFGHGHWRGWLRLWLRRPAARTHHRFPQRPMRARHAGLATAMQPMEAEAARWLQGSSPARVRRATQDRSARRVLRDSRLLGARACQLRAAPIRAMNRTRAAAVRIRRAQRAAHAHQAIGGPNAGNAPPDILGTRITASRSR